MAVDGPTGRIAFGRFEFQFLRIGTLSERHVISFFSGGADEKGIPIDEVRRIIWERGGRGGRVDTKTGEIRRFSWVGRRIGANATSKYLSEVAFVILDKEGFCEEVKLPIGYLKEVVIDDALKWKGIDGGRVSCSVREVTNEELEAWYLDYLREKTDEALSKGINRIKLAQVEEGISTGERGRDFYWNWIFISARSCEESSDATSMLGAHCPLLLREIKRAVLEGATMSFGIPNREKYPIIFYTTVKDVRRLAERFPCLPSRGGDCVSAEALIGNPGRKKNYQRAGRAWYLFECSHHIRHDRRVS
ncbi:MAG TPA: hypothetical protein ENI98_08310 [Gammaproteobacteria bacterium]|nr:hypothetical protein [Gammaproteobacteria bacterium]